VPLYIYTITGTTFSSPLYIYNNYIIVILIVFSVLMLGKSISRLQWGSLVILTAGVSLAQLAAHQKAQVRPVIISCGKLLVTDN